MSKQAVSKHEHEISKRFGASLRAIRRSQSFTQRQLADRVGIARNYVAFLERAERTPSFSILVRLSITLGVDVTELFAARPKVGEPEQIASALFLALAPRSRQTAMAMLRALGGNVGTGLRAEIKPRKLPKPKSVKRVSTVAHVRRNSGTVRSTNDLGADP